MTRWAAIALVALLSVPLPALAADEAADAYQQGLAHDRATHRDSQAVACFMRAAGLGHTRAQVALAGHYLLGKGVKRDLTQAIRWYGRAAEHGDGEAFFKLGAINQRGGARAKAYACFLLAAQFGQGDTPQKAHAALAWLGPRLDAKARRDAEELAAAWRMTIDR
jgi:TPR repeat protein